jgi:Flp pilus assembly protein CpaB
MVAFVCVLAAGSLLRAYARGVMAERPDLGPLVPVVSVTEPQPRGTTLDPTMLIVGELPARAAPPEALGTIEEAVGRTLITDLAAGEVLTGPRLAAPGSGLLAGLAPPGSRAVLTPTAMPTGTVEAGDVVDVIATFGGTRPHTEVLLFQTEVLLTMDAGSPGGFGGAAGMDGSGSNDGVSLVLAAPPETAGRIAFAGAFATITVAVSQAAPLASD